MTDKERIQRIYVIGFMGAGKTSVGECLARELRYRFLDLDREIERSAGRSIPEIFRDDGEPAFRRLEARILRSASGPTETVIACGGGTFVSWENRDFIRRNGISVWLDAPLDVMLERCGTAQHRPLLADRSRMKALLAERFPAYREADFRVDAASEPPEVIAARIASVLAGFG